MPTLLKEVPPFHSLLSHRSHQTLYRVSRLTSPLTFNPNLQEITMQVICTTPRLGNRSSQSRFRSANEPDRMTEFQVDPAEFTRLRVEVAQQCATMDQQTAEISQLRAEMNQFHAVADRQATKIESLTELVLQLSTALQRQTTAVTDRMEPRLSLPEKWDGTRGSPEGMLATLAMTFECQLARYPTSCSRVALLTSLLTGRAGEWAAALYNQKSPACNDYETFVKEMKKTFVHPSSEVSDETLLLQLRQGSQTAAQYTSRFRTTAARLRWDDAALKAVYLEGLSPRIREGMIGHEVPTSLDLDLITLAITIGRRQQERRGTQPSTRSEEHMQVGQARLTPEECERRMRGGLCIVARAAILSSSCTGGWNQQKKRGSVFPPLCSIV
uniref:Retrotransposon gag domain-containing protein n=1 Tax=Nothobranchius furzeri TaxID=105023 RepID=A0A8C6NP92_NOTFU